MGRTSEAAILCGGRGERLKPLSDYFQKVMIPMGPKKLPLLAYTIALLKSHGITKITLLTGYRSEDIRHYFGDGQKHGVELTYSEDPKDRKGSLNALANALNTGVIDYPDELLVYYGDVLADLNVGAFLRTHRKKKADATLVLAKGYMLPVGTAEVGRNGMVKAFHEKPTLELSVATGCFVAAPSALVHMKATASQANTDLMTHFLPGFLRAGKRVAAFYTTAEWYDIGTVSSFEKLDKELAHHPLGRLV